MSETYSPLTTHTWPELFGSNGRVGIQAKKFIVIHGTASTNLDSIRGAWYSNKNPNGRQASANYLVDDTRIIGAIGEEYSAWHCGGTGSITNQNSIGIEHVNSRILNPADPSTYYFSEKTIENGARLTAEICKRLGIKPSMTTIVPHRQVYATACPQTLNMSDYVARVLKYYNGTVTAKKAESIIKKGDDNQMYTIRSKSGKEGYYAVLNKKAIPISDYETIKNIEAKGAVALMIADKDFKRVIEAFK